MKKKNIVIHLTLPVLYSKNSEAFRIYKLLSSVRLTIYNKINVKYINFQRTFFYRNLVNLLLWKFTYQIYTVINVIEISLVC